MLRVHWPRPGINPFEIGRTLVPSFIIYVKIFKFYSIGARNRNSERSFDVAILAERNTHSENHCVKFRNEIMLGANAKKKKDEKR